MELVVIGQWCFIQLSSSPSWPCSPTLSWIAFLGEMGSTSLDAFAHGKVAKFFTFSLIVECLPCKGFFFNFVIAKVWQMFPQKLEKLVECTVKKHLSKKQQNWFKTKAMLPCGQVPKMFSKMI
jgi:hypothetical protein